MDKITNTKVTDIFKLNIREISLDGVITDRYVDPTIDDYDEYYDEDFPTSINFTIDGLWIVYLRKGDYNYFFNDPKYEETKYIYIQYDKKSIVCLYDDSIFGVKFKVYITNNEYTYDIISNNNTLDKFLETCHEITDYKEKLIGDYLKMTPIKY